MTCPPEIADVVREILKTGLLRIRASAWSGDSRRCAIEADHLHNLPDLLADYSAERLEYYLEAERAGFVGQSTPEQAAAFEPLWKRLAACQPPKAERVPAS